MGFYRMAIAMVVALIALFEVNGIVWKQKLCYFCEVGFSFMVSWVVSFSFFL